jgi:hypothetical protein
MCKGVEKSYTLGGMQNVIFLTEAGIYIIWKCSLWIYTLE